MKIIKLNAIDSTNAYLKSLLTDNTLEDGFTVVAESQTKGRGQYGTQWYSQQGKSLTFSMFKAFRSIPVVKQATISFAVSLGLKNALEQCNIPAVSVKWPNDILSANKKLSGILIENQVASGRIRSAVIGIGLNVNETQLTGLPGATSMYLASREQFDLDLVLQLVRDEVLFQLKRLESNEWVAIKSDYEAALFRKDLVSMFEVPGGTDFNGIIRGVSESGRICIETEAGEIKEYDFKEVRLQY